MDPWLRHQKWLHQVHSFDANVNLSLSFIPSFVLPIFKNDDDKFNLKLTLESCHIAESNQLDLETCRIGRKTLSAPIIGRILCQITSTISSRKYGMSSNAEEGHFSVILGHLPLLTGSKMCSLPREEEDVNRPDDVKGYFIIDGSEKVFVPYEQLEPNCVEIKCPSALTSDWRVTIRSVATDRAGIPSWNGRFVGVRWSGSHLDGLHLSSKSLLKKDVPLSIVLTALGLTNDRQILNMMQPSVRNSITENILRKSLEDVYFLPGGEGLKGRPTKEQAEVFLRSQSSRHQSGAKLLLDDLLEHIGKSADKNMEKAIFLCSMAKKLLLCVSGAVSATDVNSWEQRRIGLVGEFMADRLKQGVRSVWKDAQKRVGKHVFKLRDGHSRLPDATTVSSWFDSGKMKNFVEAPIKSGQLKSGYKYAKDAPGTTEILDRFSQIATLSHLHRIKKVPKNIHSKNIATRQM